MGIQRNRLTSVVKKKYTYYDTCFKRKRVFCNMPPLTSYLPISLSSLYLQEILFSTGITLLAVSSFQHLTTSWSMRGSGLTLLASLVVHPYTNYPFSLSLIFTTVGYHLGAKMAKDYILIRARCSLY